MIFGSVKNGDKFTAEIDEDLPRQFVKIRPQTVNGERVNAERLSDSEVFFFEEACAVQAWHPALAEELVPA